MIVPHVPAARTAGALFRHYVADIIYGANDGLVTTFTVVSGVAGAGLSPAVVLVLGFVNLLADGFSMGASNFLAIRSNADAEGRDRGVAEPLFHAGATFFSFSLVGAVPLIPYLFGAGGTAFLLSVLLTAAALFAVGSSRCSITSKGWLRCGGEMLAVGAVAAAVAYGAGVVLGRWVTSAA